jgi:hypothetical protein
LYIRKKQGLIQRRCKKAPLRPGNSDRAWVWRMVTREKMSCGHRSPFCRTLRHCTWLLSLSHGFWSRNMPWGLSSWVKI